MSISVDEYRQALREQWSEEQFLEATIDLAHEHGWYVFHARPARTGKGWRTPVQADGAGFPDFLAVRPPRIAVYELKVGRNRPTVKQRIWLAKFAACPAVLVRWVTAKDWDQIVEDLT